MSVTLPMPDAGQGQEAQLSNAVEEVCTAILEEVDVRRDTTGLTVNYIDSYWKKTIANIFPEYSNKIMELRVALRLAYKLLADFPNLVSLDELRGIKDVQTKSLVRDILIARSITQEEYATLLGNSNLDTATELAAHITPNLLREHIEMASELGVTTGFFNESAGTLTMEAVIEGVLTGSVNLTSNPYTYEPLIEK